MPLKTIPRIPLLWWCAVIQLDNHRRGQTKLLNVASAICYLAGGKGPISITGSAQKLFHISQSATKRNLRILEKAGLISITSTSGKPAIIHILQDPAAFRIKKREMSLSLGDTPALSVGDLLQTMVPIGITTTAPIRTNFINTTTIEPEPDVSNFVSKENIAHILPPSSPSITAPAPVEPSTFISDSTSKERVTDFLELGDERLKNRCSLRDEK